MRPAQGVEFGTPPLPQGPFQGVPVGSPLPDTVRAEFDGNPIEVLAAGSLPPTARPLGQADLRQVLQDPAGLVEGPTLQAGALQRVEGLVEAAVHAAGLQPQPLPGEGVVGAGAQSVVEVVDQGGAQGGAGAGGARVRL